MKKYKKSQKHKNHNKRHARRSQKNRLEHKEYQRKKNKSLQHVPEEARRDFLRNEYKYKDYNFVKAPPKFSLVQNPNEVIKFINKLSNLYEKRQKVYVRLDNVVSINYDAIVVLLSIMVKFKAQKIGFNGSFPENEEARRIITDSGFFQYLYKKFEEQERYDLLQSGSKIHTHAFKDVDSEYGMNIIKKYSKKIWGEERRCQGVQRTLIELMQNTNNHASIEVEGEKHWWLTVNYDEEKNKTFFGFVDFGVGIFNSLNKKEEGKFAGWREKMEKYNPFNDNSELMRKILNGELHKTVTDEHYRGKGLPGIKVAYERNQLKNLHVITNRVHADVANSTYKKLDANFQGTFVYWELDENNKNCQ